MRRPRKSVADEALPRKGRKRRTKQRSSFLGALPYCNYQTLLLGAVVLIPAAIWVVATFVVLGGGGAGSSGSGTGQQQQQQQHGPVEPGALRRRQQQGAEDRAAAATGGGPADGIGGAGGEQVREESVPGADGAASDDGAAVVANGGSKQKRAGGHSAIQSAPTERVVEELLRLARMSPADLRGALNNADPSSDDPFQLTLLRKGQCPWTGEEPTVVDWLPRRTLPQPAEWFRTRHDDTDGPSHRPSVVYYEHLSKAGGTSFCKLAQSNMPKQDVPSYYCMPSEPKKPDARVGSWSTDKLVEYISSKPHRLVSNEWEPFNLDFLSFQATSEADLSSEAGGDNRPLLVFVTSIRDPINRLLSAHKFWGILHNENKVKPTLGTWLQRLGRRASTWKVLSGDFMGNVGRFNFATWKFSGGALPVSSEVQSEVLLSDNGGGGGAGTVPTLGEDVWLGPFETAVRTLSRFDLAIPMELLSDHTGPLTDVLGWTKFEKKHVVPSGQVVNNDASSELTKAQYEALWDANKLDMLLYNWACAMYLVRVHCDVLP